MSVFANLNNKKTPLYDFSGACGVAASILLPIWQSRTLFAFQNNGAHDMWLAFGGATATATIASGVVSSVAVNNVGTGYTKAPIVHFEGGGYPPAPGTLLQGTEGAGIAGLGGATNPTNRASAHATLTGTAINTIVVDNGGSGYQVAPYVWLENDWRDQFGAAVATATFGVYVKTGTGPFILKAEFCPTSQVSVFGTNTETYTCYVAP